MALDARYRAVGFDMDGTFMRTKVDYIKLSNVIFNEMTEAGVPVSAMIREGGLKSELDSGMSWLRANGREDDISVIHERISNRSTEVEMEYADISEPFDGAVEVVDLLHDRGYRTGILTRGGHSYAEYILRRNNVIDKFDAVVARDDFPESEAKPSPMAMYNLGRALDVRPEEILYLGDHRYDWLTARDSGAGFYGVLTGGYRKEDWNALDENIQILESIGSLLDIIKN